MSKEKILFREGEWLLVRASTISQKDRDRCFTHTNAGKFLFDSVIKHLCPYDGINIETEGSPRDTRGGKIGGVSFLDEEDTVMGMCWWCMTSVPTGLITLWRLQNWDILTKVMVSDIWSEEEVNARKEDIVKIEQQIKRGTWEGEKGRAQWREDNYGPR